MTDRDATLTQTTEGSNSTPPIAQPEGRLSSSASQSLRGKGEEKSTRGKREFFFSTSSLLLEKETELCESTSVCVQRLTKKVRSQQQKANKWWINSEQMTPYPGTTSSCDPHLPARTLKLKASMNIPTMRMGPK
ncbi:hypothetical protein M422DRAFT_258123 [Sphaerobolus stellatus SS14]|uniref:Uncharacterized protein n=1 Tax=Sphaerobolus stellatus (strain SS14) TaxID=990650 RepID=A0A0C9VMP5_SPHS4|nr:hypothetical protein M422DRAFT_258123 [Sphaerobolus stellatus SS14]